MKTVPKMKAATNYKPRNRSKFISTSFRSRRQFVDNFIRRLLAVQVKMIGGVVVVHVVDFVVTHIFNMVEQVCRTFRTLTVVMCTNVICFTLRAGRIGCSIREILYHIVLFWLRDIQGGIF